MAKKSKKDRKEILVTEEGLEELKQELKVLREEKRPKDLDRLKMAREQGDLTENSEYASASQALTFTDGKIIELEEIIRHAKVVKKTSAKKIVKIGSQVVLKAKGKEHYFTVVGEWEADPEAKKISHNSPLGKALIGKKAGDTVEVKAPAGKVKYELKKVS